MAPGEPASSFDWTLGVSLRISAIDVDGFVYVCVYISAESPLSQHIRAQSEERNRLDRTSLGECLVFHRR